ncbi:hypothetical protein GE09DRAFT_1188447 [Coniochaeta sp. 2T2.1]|nr:hypothetical protein GE09DRAFT_1188447 [Coniochaeta sp. 2T2.1]
MTILTTVQSHPKLTIAVSVSATLLTAAYLAKRQLNSLCPGVSLSSLPRSSAIRILISTAEEHTTQAPPPPPPWGLTTSPLLPSWSSSTKPANDEKTSHTIHSFLALQTTIPTSLLSTYSSSSTPTPTSNNNDEDAYPLTQALLSAFLSARSTGPEARFFLDVDLPTLPISFSSPGAHLFGRSNPGELGAFLLGTWSTARHLSVSPTTTPLPADVPRPPTAFPSNKIRVAEEEKPDAAGAVMYWRAPAGLVETVDRLAAARGMPWRMVEGGYQEWIVERTPKEEEVRVTYVTVETGSLYPGAGHGEREGEGGGKRDWKKMPGWMYQLHVAYAQWLLWKTLRRLRRGREQRVG